MSTHGRKPAPDPVLPAGSFNHEAVASDVIAFDAANASDLAVVSATDTLMQIGSLRGLDFVRRVADVAAARLFLQIKKSKQFNGLAYRASDGTLRRSQTLEEVCEHFLGKSARRLYELGATYTLLGEELYETAERFGFKARDYQALKALPSSDQEAVKRALESADGELAKEMLFELAARNKALREKAEELRKDVEKVSDVLVTEERLHKAARDHATKLQIDLDGRQSADLPEVQQYQLDLLRDCTLPAERALERVANVVAEVADNPASEAIGLAARQTLSYLVQRLQDKAAELRLSISLDEPVYLAHMQDVRDVIEQSEREGKLRPMRGAKGGKG